MKKFIPFNDKIVVEPITQDSFLMGEMKPLEEMGKVIAVGSKVKFVKVGDTLFFSSWGCQKTPVVDGNPDGKRYYVVPEAGDFILGKYESRKK